MRTPVSASEGITADATATRSAGRRATRSLARPYAGNNVAVITIAFRYFAAAYPGAVAPAHHAGARKYEYSDETGAAFSRISGRPLCAIDRESSDHFSSSVKIHGDGIRVVCHAYSVRRTRYATSSG